MNNLILIITCLFSYSAWSAEWYENYENALNALNQQKWQEALQLLNAAIAVKPEPATRAQTYGTQVIDYLPYLYRGIVHYSLDQIDEAQADLKTAEMYGAVKRATADPEAYPLLLDHLVLVKKRIQKLEKDKLVASIFELALALMNQQNYSKAKEKLQTVLKLAPEHEQAQSYLQFVESEMANAPPTDASAENDDLREKSKPNAQKKLQDLLHEGILLFNNGQLKKSKKKFAAVLERQLDSLQASSYFEKITLIESKFEKGITAYFEGQNDQAIQYFTDAEKLYPHSAHIYAFLGCAFSAKYFLTGEHDEEMKNKAVQNFNQAKSLTPNYHLDRRFISPRIIEMYEGLQMSSK